MKHNTLTKEQTILHELIYSWQPEMVIKNIIPLKADASMRRYFRVFLQSGQAVVGMLFDSVKAAEVGSGPKVPADEAYFELSKYFRLAGLPVAECFAADLHLHGLLIEDLGDQLLGDLPDKDQYCQQAIEIIHKMQSIPEDNNLLAFQRAFTTQTFLTEMQEFNDYFLEMNDSKSALKELVTLATIELAAELMQIPFKLAHRDFHLWNLMLKNEKVYLIDFQDALLAPYPYDLISLLNDRDSDRLLGEVLHAKLKKAYSSCLIIPNRDFEADYIRTSLQRDLKVIGRFAKLATTRGLKQYLKWIPGTLKRVKSGFAYLAKSNENYVNISNAINRLE